jgi:hypothetical protein
MFAIFDGFEYNKKMDLPITPSISLPTVTTVHDGPSIALYILSAVGLLLFIVVMVITIIMWAKPMKPCPPCVQRNVQNEQNSGS